MSTSENSSNIKTETEGNEEKTEYGELTIIPTSHVSEESGSIVREAITEKDPDVVAVELDTDRLQRLLQKNANGSSPENTRPSVSALFSKDMTVKKWVTGVFLQTLQTKISGKLGLAFEDMDMLSGVQTAFENDKQVALIDRNIQETMNRLTNETSIREIVKFIAILGVGIVQISFKSKDEIETTLGDAPDKESKEDMDEIISAFEEHFPGIKRILLDERDIYMSQNIHTLLNEGNDVVAVVGAAHKPGITNLLENPDDIPEPTNETRLSLLRKTDTKKPVPESSSK